MDFENSTDTHVIFFDETYHVKGFNDSFAKFFNIDGSIVGMYIDDLPAPDFLAEFFHSDEKELKLSSIIKNRWINIKRKVLCDGNNVFGYMFILEDVTEEVLNNRELISLKSAVEDVQHAMSMSIHFKDARGKYHWTPETYALIDREPRPEDVHKNIFEAITVRNLDKIADTLPKLGDGDLYVDDFTIKTESGKTKYLRGTARKVYDGDGNFLRLSMTAQDRTKEHLQEANLQIMDSLMSNTNYHLGVGGYVHEIGGEYLRISQEAINIADLNEKDGPHKMLKDFRNNFVDSEGFKNEIRRLSSGEVDEVDFFWDYKSPKTGEIKKLHIINYVKVVNGRVFALGGIKDVTKEFERQAQLEQHNKEMEILIRECNHRMKNNLNLLLRFISLEKRFNKDDADKIIENTVGRIESLALLHEKLYNADNLKDVNVKEYLNSLGDELYSLFGGEGSLNYTSNDCDLILSGEILIPISLILTELTMNSIKYAFTDFDVDEKVINVSVDKFGNKLILHYSDNGKGMPEGFNPSKNTGLGWMIIQSLSNQLDGEYDVFNDNGMNFKLSFYI